ncbi:MAG: YheU family protein [Proteobacteria bacterium]|jgi:uncharacterized protein YheU (UPF0270 family)|nr:YheU family protein [Pseudomonadota bacterium]
MDDTAEPLQIPPELLSPEALRGVLEDFVLREGTDYGLRDWSLDEKVAQVALQLQRGEVSLMFDPETQSVTLVTRDQLPKSL